MDRSSRKPSFVLVLLLASVLAVSLPHSAHGQGGAPIIGVWSTAYNSANITDASLVMGSTFHVQLNVTGAPFTGWNGYETVLYYDQRYLSISSYDIFTGTIFGSTAFASPSTYNGPGALRLSIVDRAVAIADSGLLVDITFQVVKAGGVSSLTLAAGMTQNGNGASSLGSCPGCPGGAPNWSRLVKGDSLIGVETSDGYFKNEATSTGPVARFTYSPANPAQGDTVTFNATNSFDPDNNNTANHGISTYFWDFGDISDNSNVTTTNPIQTHDFKHGGTGGTTFFGNFSVLLRVTEEDHGFQAMQTQLLTISPPPTHCVAVTGIFAKSQIVQGSPETVQVQITNTGTYNEQFNLTVLYGPPNATVSRLTGLNIAPSKIVSYPAFNINTTDLPPVVYNVFAIVSLSSGQNCAAGASQSQFQVTNPLPTGGLLLILEGIAVIVAILVIVGLLLKRRRRPEPP
ncbi:MAG TPA: cohesin domain-containing protein [Candidatus Bathyarchaeia archaeon]|nr:cohesin domain-containing protein [Candidatus Bathyarchaeia archaeon]